MAKKIIKRLGQPFDISKNHTYADGGGLLNWLNNTGNKLTGDSGKNADGTPSTGAFGLTKGGMSLVTGAANIGSGIMSSVLNPNGNTTGAGSAMQSIGSIASQIPGIGGLIGAGLSNVGGMVNAAFGSKLNTEFINQTEDKIKTTQNTTSNADTTSQLMSDMQNATDLQHVSKSQVGSQGLFSHAASNKANSLNQQIDKANFTMNRNMGNAANNIATNMNIQAQQNYYANGGGLTFSEDMGNMFANGGYMPSQGIRNQISQWEGSTMRTNTPMSIKAREVQSITPNFNMLNQNQQDALFSYYYNVKPSTYKKNIVPLMSKLGTSGDKSGILQAVASNINTGMGRPGMSGLTTRRLYEQGLFTGTNPINTPIGLSISQSSNLYAGDDQLLQESQQHTGEDLIQSMNTGLSNIVNATSDFDPNNVHYSAFGGNLFANGGSININPANKGKLTATARRTGKSFSELAHSKNPLTRKRAQFALNARHFNHSHEDGGDLSDDDLLMGDIFADGGGLSRQADYGSSKKPYPSVKSSDFAGGGRSYPIPTRADAVDALRLAGLHGREDVKAKVYAKYPDLKHSKAEGGDLDLSNGGIFSDGVTTFDTGGTHEENPLGGIPQGIASDGKPNLVEQGEVKYNNYIYSNRNSPGKELLQVLGLNPSYSNRTFASAAEQINKESKERPYDPVSQNGLKENMKKLQAIQELQRSIENSHKKADGGSLDDIVLPTASVTAKGVPFTNPVAPTADNPVTQGQIKPLNVPITYNTGYKIPSDNTVGNVDNSSALSGLRYAPVIGSGVMALSDALGITNKPNYSNADRIGDVVNSFRPVSATPVGQKLSYQPFDTQFYQNKLGNQTSANAANIINTSGGNRANAMAGLLANNYNYGNNVGNLARQAAEENLNQKMQVANFNRGTDEFNSDANLRAAMANQSMNQLRLAGTEAQAELRQNQKNQSDQARSTNLSNFLQNLGNLGIDTANRNMVNGNPALKYLSGANGNLLYKAAINNGGK